MCWISQSVMDPFSTRYFRLRDVQWKKSKDMLPDREETVGVTAKENRLFIESEARYLILR
jgi:hypothetical protein